MILAELNERYDDLVESVSVWYGFFREGGCEMGQSSSRVMSQLQCVVETNSYLLLIAYLLLIKEVLSESEPDEEVIVYLYDSLIEEFREENIVFMSKFIVNQLSEVQKADLLSHLNMIHDALRALPSVSMAHLSEQLVLVG